MVKETIAAGILVALFALAMVDTGVVSRKTDNLIAELEQAQELCVQGDAEGSRKLVRSSFEAWHEWDSYASVMLRHAEEVDTVTEAYFMLFEKLQSEEQVAPAAFEMLISNLQGLSSTGKLSLGSLF